MNLGLTNILIKTLWLVQEAAEADDEWSRDRVAKRAQELREQVASQLANDPEV